MVAQPLSSLDTFSIKGVGAQPFPRTGFWVLCVSLLGFRFTFVHVGAVFVEIQPAAPAYDGFRLRGATGRVVCTLMCVCSLGVHM